MKTISNFMAVAVVCVLTMSCMPETFTAIANETGQTIRLSVKSKGVEVFSFDAVEPGKDKGAAVIQRVGEIDSIEYSFQGKNCRLERREILRLARLDNWPSNNKDKYTITLSGC